MWKRAAIFIFLVLEAGAVPAASPPAGPVEAPPDLTVSGRLLGDGGAPLAGLAIELAPAGTTPGGDGGLPVRSDENGSFVATLPRPGMWRLWLPAEGAGTGGEEAAAVERPFVDLAVVEPLALGPLEVERFPRAPAGGAAAEGEGPPAAGVTVDGETGRPLAGALVWAAGHADRWTLSEVDGTFSLPLPTRPPEHFQHVLVALAPGRLPAAAGVGERPGEARLRLALPPAAAISGQVVDGGGRPLGGVVVSFAARRSGPRSARMPSDGDAALTDTDGRFRLRWASPGRPVAVEARHPDRRPATATVPPLAAGAEHRGLRIVLAPGRRAFGRVTDLDGAAVGGARVEAHADADRRRFRGTDPPAASAETDGAGRFELTVDSDLVDLEIAAPGFAPARIPGVEVPPGDAPADLGTVRLSPEAPIEGWVVDPDGRPVAGARVAISPAAGSFHSFARWRRGADDRMIAADVEGRFAIGGLAAGERIGLRVAAPGFALGGLPVVAAPTDEPLRIVLEPGVGLRGRVVDGRGRPLPDAVVSASHPSPDGGRRSVRLDADAEGRFELDDLPAGPVTLRAEAPDHVSRELELEATPDAPAEDLEIVLEEGAVIAGRVVDPTGTPISGVAVVVADSRGGPRWGDGSAVRSLAPSDADGRFRITGVPLGEQVLEARSRDHQPTTATVEVLPGENRAELVVRRALAIRGWVVGPDGGPVAGATVSLSEGPSSRGRGTDPAGAFELPGLEPGSYRLSAAGGGFASSVPMEVELVDADLEGIELRLRRGGVVRGIVVGLDEDEIARLRVVAWRKERPGPLIRHEARLRWDGSFVLENLDGGRWEVEARLPDHRRVAEEVALAPGGEVAVELAFRGGATLSGRVIRDGRPEAGAMVQVHREEGGGGMRKAADHRGEFRIEGLEPGRHVLTIPSATGYAHYEILDVAGDTEIEIEISTARLAGRVLDPDGLPLAGASVQLRHATHPVFLPGHPTARTDDDGRFAIDDVGPGDHVLVARLDGYGEASVPIAVRAGDDPPPVELVLEPTSGLRVEVVSATGAALGRVAVAAVADDGRLQEAEATAGARRTLELPSLPAGRWRLTVTAPGHARRFVAARVPGPPIVVALDPEARLEVTVPALADEPFAHLDLVAADGTSWPAAPGPVPSRPSLAAGRASVGELPAGTWTVRVRTPDGRTWEGAATLAAGATTELVLP